MLRITLAWNVQTIVLMPNFTKELQGNNLNVIEDQVYANNQRLLTINASSAKEVKLVRELATKLFNNFLLEIAERSG